ncbi:hypothetical protein ARMA_2825 [Ardenticatena maritima]|uniref:Uncharacterized protein n=1 Tax=Ardenticatena maritima TaxID=872965 RepID=A0A0M8KB36_9CHLR|nr:hypothetical protein [Ardenticatena maritima]KPL89660.1 hypothetical protein SE16_04460 [Ardenticatena maritima]GAP64402.1 hypothetical protein ARMA_2825 [Ardenticatena maritima]
MTVEEIAADILAALEALTVEDVWDATGASCFFATEPAQAADLLIERVLLPYETRLRQLAREGREAEADTLLEGVLRALSLFERESRAPFKAWVLNLEATYAPRFRRAREGRF